MGLYIYQKAKAGVLKGFWVKFKESAALKGRLQAFGTLATTCWGVRVPALDRSRRFIPIAGDGEVH